MWLSVALPTDAAHAEALSEALMAQGAISVSIEDADAGTTAETPQFGEPGSPVIPLWDNSRIVALFEQVKGIDGTAATNDLIGRIAAAWKESGQDILNLPEIGFDEVAEQNWVQLTQSQFEPIRINQRLWIVPSWHAAPDPSAINLILDPGMAFGTGSHPTTRLCLEWLCENLGESAHGSVLDYGCGSGILAIAAAKLGASRVLGIDIDEQALAAARDNAERNAVRLELRHSQQSLIETFDCVIANILTNPLCVLAPLLAARMSPKGHIVLSGILESQTTQVIAAYAPFVGLHPGAVLDGWVRLEGKAVEP